MKTKRSSDSPTEAAALIVGLDAATPICSVALAGADGNLMACLRQESRLPASQRLLADLDMLFSHGQVDPRQIKAVAVTVGPGTFTGLRVGLAMAKTLAHGWNVPLYGYSTLEICARRWPVPGSVVSVLLDARRGELYSGLYRLDQAGQPQRLRPDRVETAENALAELTAADWPLICFSGNGAALHREQIRQKLGARAQWIPSPWDGPGADALALAAARDWAEGRPGLDSLGAAAVYLRASDAERRHGVTI